MLQYLAMPMFTSYQGGILVASGRRIELSDWVVKSADRKAVAGKLLARSLYNGQILWQRELPKISSRISRSAPWTPTGFTLRPATPAASWQSTPKRAKTCRPW